MKLNTSKSLNNLHLKRHLKVQKQQTNNTSLVDQRQIEFLTQKLQSLQEKHKALQKTYISKIEKLKYVISKQNMTSTQLYQEIARLKQQNRKQLKYLDLIKGQILDDMNPQIIVEQNQLINYKSLNLRTLVKRSKQSKDLRSKLSSRPKLFQSTSNIFGRSMLKKATSVKDLRTQYFQTATKLY